MFLYALWFSGFYLSNIILFDLARFTIEVESSGVNFRGMELLFSSVLTLDRWYLANRRLPTWVERWTLTALCFGVVISFRILHDLTIPFQYGIDTSKISWVPFLEIAIRGMIGVLLIRLLILIGFICLLAPWTTTWIRKDTR